MYPADMVKPMIDQLTEVGFEEMHTASEIEDAIKAKGTLFVVINSVCGCAARNARPGAIQSLQSSKRPDKIVTVFAGVDTESVKAVREHMLPFPASSPSMVLFKDGEMVHILERHHLEGRPAEVIAENLKDAFEEFC